MTYCKQGISARATVNSQRQKDEAEKKHAVRGSELHAALCPAAFVAAPMTARCLVASDDGHRHRCLRRLSGPNAFPTMVLWLGLHQPPWSFGYISYHCSSSYPPLPFKFLLPSLSSSPMPATLTQKRRQRGEKKIIGDSCFPRFDRASTPEPPISLPSYFTKVNLLTLPCPFLSSSLPPPHQLSLPPLAPPPPPHTRTSL